MYQSIRPGKIWLDSNGNRIQAHGGSIIFAEGKFWWYGENKKGVTGRATGERCPYWHHGVKLYSSTDLYNWVDEGFAFEESDDINSPFYAKNIMDRPHILYNEKNKNYVMWAKTTTDDSFNECAFSICVGKDLHSFKYLKQITPDPYHAGDFDLFIKDGRAYVVFENPHTKTVLQQLDDDYTGLTNNITTHQEQVGPPFTREAPAHFSVGNKDYLLTSGTTGYFPNPTQIDDITELNGNWINLGNACVGDKHNNSFWAQFSSVFKHPFIKGLYIALGDRWLTDLEPDLPNMSDVFFGLFTEGVERKLEWEDVAKLTDENTSEANYVWLPITFNEHGKPEIHWKAEWTIEEFKK